MVSFVLAQDISGVHDAVNVFLHADDVKPGLSQFRYSTGQTAAEPIRLAAGQPMQPWHGHRTIPAQGVKDAFTLG